MLHEVCKKPPYLARYGSFQFRKFTQELESYRAMKGDAPLFVLIQQDVRSIYESVCQCKLVNPEEATDQERLKANEVEFLTKVRSHFGRKTALDT
ncbi:hypothetical protein ADUPG1_007402, partial [Aduncisulcus paluster]